MSDRFLYDARPVLDREFSEELYQKITGSHLSQRTVLSSKPLIRGLLRAMAIAGLCLGILLVSSTAARAEFAAMMNSIGNNLQTTMSNLIGRIIVIETEPSEMEVPPEEMLRQGVDSPLVLLPVPQAFQVFPIPIAIPTWAPSPCELEDNALVDQNDAHPSITLIWACASDASSRIFMTVEKASMVAHYPPDTYKEITVQGEPGLVVHGIWHRSGNEFTWVNDTMRIFWYHDNLLYDLMAPAGQFIEEDLLQMAESVH